MKMHRWLLMVLLLAGIGFSVPASAQSSPEEMNTVEFSSQPQATSQPEMADVMRQDGKIYIVVTVLVSVLLGVLLYLINLDKKIGFLERQMRE